MSHHVIVNGVSLPRRMVLEEALRQRKWRFFFALLLFSDATSIEWPVEPTTGTEPRE